MPEYSRRGKSKPAEAVHGTRALARPKAMHTVGQANGTDTAALSGQAAWGSVHQCVWWPSGVQSRWSIWWTLQSPRCAGSCALQRAGHQQLQAGNVAQQLQSSPATPVKKGAVRASAAVSPGLLGCVQAFSLHTAWRVSSRRWHERAARAAICSASQQCAGHACLGLGGLCDAAPAAEQLA